MNELETTKQIIKDLYDIIEKKENTSNALDYIQELKDFLENEWR